MKIAKGHYVPKKLITSKAVCEAVVNCFAAAGFHRNRDYVDYREKEHWGCIAISGSGAICWSDEQEHSLTLQQLFTAENGLQWPDWAESINSYGPNCVAFYGECSVVLIAGNLMEFERNDAAILATRQPKGEVSETSESKPDAEASWYELGEFPPVGAECEVYNHAFGKNADWERCKILWRGEFLTVYASDSHHECSANNEHLEFRQIKAKTEREKVIEAALDAAIENDGIPLSVVPHINQILERIYDAGMLVLPLKKSDTED